MAVFGCLERLWCVISNCKNGCNSMAETVIDLMNAWVEGMMPRVRL